MNKRRSLVSVSLAAMLFVASCGGDDGSEGTTAPAPDTVAETPDTVAETPDTVAETPDTVAETPDTVAETPDTVAVPPGEGGYAIDDSWGGVAESSAEGVCGLGNGEEATGDPVKIGSVSFIPAFKEGPNAMAAYIKCVNANGGIHGRPLEYISLDDESDPAKATAAATKLIENEGVVAIAGGFSFLDCPVNGPYYKEKGFNIIVAGVPAECFGSSNIAATNMGPHYSAQGAAQAVIRAGAKGKIVHLTGNAPGSEYNGSSIKPLAEAAGLEFEDMIVELEGGTTIKDPTTAVLNAVEAAGEGGGVVITFIPPAVLQIMQVADEQGLVDKVIWGSATPANDVSVASAAPASWNGKLLINAELAPLDSNGPDMTLLRSVLSEYDDQGTSVGAFAQMGFLIGRIMVQTLNAMPAADVDDPAKVNAAIKGILNYKTDILCKPWYYGDGDFHVPNNWDFTVTPQDGKMVVAEKCFEIEAQDDVLKSVRADEAAANLNQG